MGLRILIAMLVGLALALGLWSWQTPDTPATERARALEGERWYKLSLAGRHLGYWHTRTHRDSSGRWIFESEQRFALNPGDPALGNNLATVLGEVGCPEQGRALLEPIVEALPAGSRWGSVMAGTLDELAARRQLSGSGCVLFSPGR